MRCLEKDRERRYDSASALDMQVFEQFLSSVVNQKQPVILPMRKAG